MPRCSLDSAADASGIASQYITDEHRDRPAGLHRPLHDQVSFRCLMPAESAGVLDAQRKVFIRYLGLCITVALNDGGAIPGL